MITKKLIAVLIAAVLSSCAPSRRHGIDEFNTPKKHTLVYYWGAEWCSACKVLAPIAKKISDKCDAVFIEKNMDSEDESKYGLFVPQIPVFTLLKQTSDGKYYVQYHGPWFDGIEAIICE